MIVGTSKRFATGKKGFNPAPSLGLPCLPDPERSARPASVPLIFSLGRHPGFLSAAFTTIISLRPTRLPFGQLPINRVMGLL